MATPKPTVTIIIIHKKIQATDKEPVTTSAPTTLPTKKPRNTVPTQTTLPTTPPPDTLFDYDKTTAYHNTQLHQQHPFNIRQHQHCLHTIRTQYHHLYIIWQQEQQHLFNIQLQPPRLHTIWQQQHRLAFRHLQQHCLFIIQPIQHHHQLNFLLQQQPWWYLQ